MSTETAGTASTSRVLGNIVLNIAALVLFYFGMTVNLLFISAGLVCLAMSMIGSGQKKWGYITFGVAVLYFLVVFGYGMGKDMAVRDNAASAAATAGYGVTIYVRADAKAPARIAHKSCARPAHAASQA